MIVEFIGVSGSGKTTLAHAIARRLVADGVDARVRFRQFEGPFRRARHHLLKGASVSRFLLRRPRRAWAMARLVGTSGQPDPRVAATLTQSLWYLESIRESEGERCDVLLLHQGLCQLLWSLAFSTTDDGGEVLRRGYGQIRKADLYVHVAAAPEVLATRLGARSRTGSRVQRDLAEGRATLARSAMLADALCELLERDARPVLRYRFDEGDDLDAVARRFASSILARRHEAAPRSD